MNLARLDLKNEIVKLNPNFQNSSQQIISPALFAPKIFMFLYPDYQERRSYLKVTMVFRFPKTNWNLENNFFEIVEILWNLVTKKCYHPDRNICSHRWLRSKGRNFCGKMCFFVDLKKKNEVGTLLWLWWPWNLGIVIGKHEMLLFKLQQVPLSIVVVVGFAARAFCNVHTYGAKKLEISKN